jgi:hypothetical protein
MVLTQDDKKVECANFGNKMVHLYNLEQAEEAGKGTYNLSKKF